MPNQLHDELAKMSLEQVRSNIERIIASYRHVSDIYAELLQNSADAIIEQFGADHMDQGRVTLHVWPGARKLLIQDNGVGIAEKDLSSVLVNGKSLKRERNQGKYGFMGFGLTFVAFQTEYLKIESVHGGMKASRTYRDLYKFVYQGSDLPPADEEAANTPAVATTEPSGTTLTAVFPTCLPDATLEQMISRTFRYAANSEAFVAALRTRTAVGLIAPLFTQKPNFTFSLLIDGQPIPVEAKYLTTREVVQRLLPTEQRIYDINQRFQQLLQATESMPVRQQDAARKCIVLDEMVQPLRIGTYSPLQARLYVACTSKDLLNKFNEQILHQPVDGEECFRVENGLWLALDGMPTGICLDTYSHAAFLPFSAIIDIQDQSVRKELDAGRKGISEYRVSQICNEVGRVLRDHGFIKYRKHVVGADPRIGNPLYDPKQELQNKCNDKQRYPLPLVQPFLPPLEEQAVITLFVELLARGTLKGYEQKVISGYEVYDGLYAYDLSANAGTLLAAANPYGVAQTVFDQNGGTLKKDLLVEFKTDFEALYRDIDKNRKDISHIDILVCWSTGPQNAQYYQTTHGDLLQRKADATNVFFGVTHELVTGKRQQPLPIIELRALINGTFNLNLP